MNAPTMETALDATPLESVATTQRASTRGRRLPASVKSYCALLIGCAFFMALLGWSASGYYVTALYLALQALLLWRARGHAFFKGTIVINQISGLVLILVLWLGDGLGPTKLDISGAMLLLNVLCGGPLMGILAVPLMHSMKKGHRLYQWFHPNAAREH
jgi:hypothetical protein